jgi:hypothetical protein
MTELAADLSPSIEVAGDTVRAALFFDDASDVRLRSLGDNLLLKEIVPAEALADSHLSL